MVKNSILGAVAGEAALREFIALTTNWGA